MHLPGQLQRFQRGSAMNESSQDLLLNRINFDPIVFMGCSEREIFIAMMGTGSTLLGAGGLLGFLCLGSIFSGVIIGFFLSVPVVFGVLWLIGLIKRDQEPGYLQQRITDALEKHHLVKSPIIRRSGPWSTGRRA